MLRFSTPFRLAAAAMKTLYARLAGYEIFADFSVLESRLEECDACDHLTSSRQCEICTCFVDGKAAMAVEACPKKRWVSVWKKKANNPRKS